MPEVVPARAGSLVGPATMALGWTQGHFYYRLAMWYLYIIYSENLDKYYTGVTDELEWRLERHNQGWSRSTKGGIPWRIVYIEEYETKADALKREREIKRRKSRKYIESLI
jgi:putative endonuclease